MVWSTLRWAKAARGITSFVIQTEYICFMNIIMVLTHVRCSFSIFFPLYIVDITFSKFYNNIIITVNDSTKTHMQLFDLFLCYQWYNYLTVNTMKSFLEKMHTQECHVLNLRSPIQYTFRLNSMDTTCSSGLQVTTSRIYTKPSVSIFWFYLTTFSVHLSVHSFCSFSGIMWWAICKREVAMPKRRQIFYHYRTCNDNSLYPLNHW